MLNKKIIVYDFINMDILSWISLQLKSKSRKFISWNFISHGEMPDEAMEKNFEATMLMIMPMIMKTD
jgi:hypothetical protein